MSRRTLFLLLDNAPLLIFVALFAVFGSISTKFLEPRNLVNILVQSSAIGIVAIGMTFVMLTAGVDLAVGSVMFVAVALAGKIIFQGQPIWLGFAAALGVGALAGALNAAFITRLRIIPFIVTLAMLFVWRGFGLWITETRAMNMPDAVTQLGAARLAGVPTPVIAFALVCLTAHIALTRTAFGRQIYAIGNDVEGARKAGIRVGRVVFFVYVICGACAALSGFVSLTQTGAVSPSFGKEKEFAAIAAAALGGASLFGGRGNVFPGTVIGALLIQSVDAGLVIVNADPYVYPLVTSGVILLAALVDSARNRALERLRRPSIQVESHDT